MDDAILLSAQHITKQFPGVRALDNVSFDLRQGEIHAILGENGAGKSTLIKILGGVEERDSGSLLISGQPANLRDPHDAQRKGIRVIHQELNLLPLLSVAENIYLGNLPAGRLPGSVDWRGMMAGAAEVLRRLHVDLDPAAPAGKLTAAQQQLVEIAQALTTDIRALIMDEPTSALNDVESEALFDLLKRMVAERSIGVVYITHRIAEVFKIANRVTVLRDGAHVATLPVNEVNSDQLVQLMVGRALGDMYVRHRVELGEVVLESRDLSTAGGLKSINFSLHAGEILGVYGLLGSGRSLLARTLIGATPISSGQILLRGKPVHMQSPHQARRLGIGYLPVDRKAEGLILPLSVGKNLTLAGLGKYSRGFFVDDRAEKASAEHWSHALNIQTPSVETKIGALSGGNQQKAIVGRWLDAQATILIMNEPTRGIDVGAKTEIYALMDNLCQQNVGILMFSSEMPEILAIADRILVMSSGRITGDLPHDQATQEALMKHAVE